MNDFYKLDCHSGSGGEAKINDFNVIEHVNTLWTLAKAERLYQQTFVALAQAAKYMNDFNELDRRSGSGG